MLKVKPKTLLLLTGFIWLVASCILISRVFIWSIEMTSTQIYIGLLSGLVLAFIKTYLIFRKLTIRNIQRIQSFSESNVSILKFHLMRDKVIILLMILIGIVLRKSSILPTYVLFPIYLGIGVAMFYVFILYIKAYFENRNSNRVM